MSYCTVKTLQWILFIWLAVNATFYIISRPPPPRYPVVEYHRRSRYRTPPEHHRYHSRRHRHRHRSSSSSSPDEISRRQSRELQFQDQQERVIQRQISHEQCKEQVLPEAMAIARLEASRERKGCCGGIFDACWGTRRQFVHPMIQSFDSDYLNPFDPGNLPLYRENTMETLHGILTGKYLLHGLRATARHRRARRPRPRPKRTFRLFSRFRNRRPHYVRQPRNSPRRRNHPSRYIAQKMLRRHPRADCRPSRLYLKVDGEEYEKQCQLIQDCRMRELGKTSSREIQVEEKFQKCICYN